MTWISIKEKLPAENQPVLLYNINSDPDTVYGLLDNYLVSALTTKNGQPEWEDHLAAPQSLTNYTHWMPLPEPPRSEDEHARAIQMVADSIVSHHIPNDSRLNEFSFRIIVEGQAYEVSYKKDADGYWAFTRYK
ncbi:DUF551 domain-containing protein [Mucilaginibacter lacusdianchii]|uniref:DUF551 domain-containing protein n=1 Tax=Mucilaginibacter lacusdianchii TaxID=2684211 RepID=UPI00131AC4B0|nr:DUF551 domain-containing protein [Mucilaginibacter sp. JXJ CY 39]